MPREDWTALTKDKMYRSVAVCLWDDGTTATYVNGAYPNAKSARRFGTDPTEYIGQPFRRGKDGPRLQAVEFRIEEAQVEWKPVDSTV